MEDVKLFAEVRRRDMLGVHCIWCGDSRFAERRSDTVGCCLCGTVIPRHLTKAELIEFLPEEEGEMPVE